MGNRWTPITTEIGLSQARNELHHLIRAATSGNARFIIWRGQQHECVAALIAYEDLQQLAAPKAADEATAPAVSPPHAELSAEYLYTVGGEDRIATEHVQGIWPLVVVADGIGGAPGGAAAADAAAAAACEYLREQLPQLSTCEHVLSALRQTYDQVAARMREQDLAGATTLLIGLLWSSPAACFWCYAYVGDGFLTVLSPNRSVDSLTIPERLLTPQKARGTACLDRDGPTTGPPVVGLRLMEPGDVLYLATDGIIPLFQWVRDEHRETLDYFLETRVGRSREWADLLRACPGFVDDAVMGVIRTGDA